MTKSDTKSIGTREKPWALNTPGGKAEFTAFRDTADQAVRRGSKTPKNAGSASQ